MKNDTGGPAWRTLLETHGTLAGALFSLRISNDPKRVAPFVAAARQAPPKHRDAADELVELLADPQKAARTRTPERVMSMIPRLPQSVALARARVPALAILAKRIELGKNAKTTTAFIRASWFFTPFRPAAFAASRGKEWGRWRRVIEDRMFAKNNHAVHVLFWLGDDGTFDRLLAAKRRTGLQNALAEHLAKVLDRTYDPVGG